MSIAAPWHRETAIPAGDTSAMLLYRREGNHDAGLIWVRAGTGRSGVKDTPPALDRGEDRWSLSWGPS